MQYRHADVDSREVVDFTSTPSIEHFADMMRARAKRCRALAEITHNPDIIAELLAYARELEAEAEGLAASLKA